MGIWILVTSRNDKINCCNQVTSSFTQACEPIISTVQTHTRKFPKLEFLQGSNRKYFFKLEYHGKPPARLQLVIESQK